MSDFVEIEVEFVHETERAMLVKDEDGDELWIPKSLIPVHDIPQMPGDLIEISVAEWFAMKEGLI